MLVFLQLTPKNGVALKVSKGEEEIKKMELVRIVQKRQIPFKE